VRRGKADESFTFAREFLYAKITAPIEGCHTGARGDVSRNTPAGAIRAEFGTGRFSITR